MKPIFGFSNYQITIEGKIWSEPRNGTSGGYLSPDVDKDGYSRVRLYKKGYPFKFFVHTLVLETFVGPCPEGMECRHLDGNPRNNHIENLCWDTHHNNILDKIKHGTQINLKGEQHPSSKLIASDVRMIIYMYRTGLFLQRELAEIFSLSIQHVSDIINKNISLYH